MVDSALAKTGEESVKMRMVGERDIETVLIEEYNNGWIDIRRLQKLSKLMKDNCYELVRQHTFKSECIEEAEKLKLLVDSVRLHREEGRPRAIYDSKGDPYHSEDRILSQFANRIEYIWYIGAYPVMIVAAAFLFLLISLMVIFFEISLYLSADGAGGVYENWLRFSDSNDSTSFLMANFICMMPLAYICFASFYSFFKIKVHSFYALHPK